MKRLTKNLLVFGLALTFFTACNTDNGIECPEDFVGALATSEQILVGEWVLTAITSEDEVDLTDDNEDNPSKDIFVQYEPCQKDAFYTFSSNRAYTFEQGQRAEDCERKVNVAGTWQLANNILSLVGSCNVQNIDIEFNEDNTEFEFTQTFDVTDVDGTTIQTEVTITYSK